MISKLIAMFVALFLGIGLMITGGSLSRGQPHQTTQSFAVSKYGTLLEIFDANGKSRFGKLTNNGFQVSYRSKGKTKSISAVGEKTEGLVEGEVKVDGQSATVTATTSDHALEITTYFILDEKTKKLIIQRKFRNISGGPLTLKTMREFVDAVVITGETVSTQSEVLDGQKQKLSPAKLATLAKSRLKAALPFSDCQAGECPDPPPPCLPCPPKIAFKVARLIIKTNPVDWRLDKIGVQWLGLRLEPSLSTTKLQRNEVSTLVEVHEFIPEQMVSR